MGLDIGDRRIGVAVSDPTQTLAIPLKTIVRKDDESAVLEITALIKQHDIGRLVIGLPYLLDGSLGEQARKVMEFTAKIRGRTAIETVMQDERLTSVTAGQKLRITSDLAPNAPNVGTARRAGNGSRAAVAAPAKASAKASAKGCCAAGAKATPGPARNGNGNGNGATRSAKAGTQGGG